MISKKLALEILNLGLSSGADYAEILTVKEEIMSFVSMMYE